MENQKNAKKYKRNVFKRIVFLLLFVILLPFMLIGYFIKLAVKSHKRKKWEKYGLKDKALVLKVDIADVDKMQDYELEYYLKTLFFYNDYKVLEVDYKKDNLFFAERYNNSYAVIFKKVKKLFEINHLFKLRKIISKQKTNQAIIVTNGVVSDLVKNEIKANELIIDREKLIEMIFEVKSKLGLTTKKDDLIDKFDRDIQDKFPNMI